MISILITAKNSYIGNSLKEYLETKFPGEYAIDLISLRDEKWKDVSFNKYDTVFHVAGIAHSDAKSISKSEQKKYYIVNTNLTYEVALKAKEEGVSQFVFMSSMIIYGDSSKIGCKKLITKDTVPCPKNAYGNSKYEAERAISKLEDDSFKIAILRPPMIYGKASKGNYPILSKFAKSFPFFPKVENERSMIYVGNFVEFVRLVIKNEERGIFFPQNLEYTNTSKLVQTIAKINDKKVVLIPGVTWMLKLLSGFTTLVNKAFGSLTYDMCMSEYKENYRLYSLEESIRETEK